MKVGDKIKAYVQVGLMKKPRWIRGTMLEDGMVEVSGNKLKPDCMNVKLWQPLKYIDGRCPEIESFRDENWEGLKRVVTESVARFFPEDEVRVDEDEKIISVADINVCVGVKEAASIAAFREVPVWTVTYFRHVPATRWEPDDVDEVNCGDSSTTIGAARILVDALWKFHTDGYWAAIEENLYETEENGS